MMRRNGPRLLVVLAVLVAGWGTIEGAGSNASTPVAPKYRVAVPGHPCDPAQFYMQCAAGAPGAIPSPPALNFTFAPLFGIDFAWGGPSGAVAHAFGVREAISYLSGGTSKDWTPAQLADYTRAGVAVVFVWETAQYRPLSGCAGGRFDAFTAESELRRDGYAGAPVYTAADFDTSGYSATGVVGQYLHCFAVQLGGDRGGAYGGLKTMAIARAQGVRHLWQTYAWSWGVWDKGACLRQYLNGQSWHGYSVDFDVAVCGDYGQYNPPTPRRVHCFGPQRQLANATCRSIRPKVARWSRARDSSLRALDRQHCLYSAIVKPSFTAQPLFHRRPSCNTFARRAGYFAQHVHNNLH